MVAALCVALLLVVARRAKWATAVVAGACAAAWADELAERYGPRREVARPLLAHERGLRPVIDLRGGDRSEQGSAEQLAAAWWDHVPGWCGACETPVVEGVWGTHRQSGDHARNVARRLASMPPAGNN